MNRSEGDVFFKDWFICFVGGHLDFKDLCRWDVAMSSQRKKWLQGLSNVKIPGIDGYEHSCNESVRWLISRRIQHVSNITYDDSFFEICSKSFTGARVLVNISSISLHSCSVAVLNSLKVNCPYLEKVHIKTKTESFNEESKFAAAARMVQYLPRLREFTFTQDNDNLPDVIFESSSPLLHALALYCPLLETLHLAKYNDEGLAELVAGCLKLHTLTIDSDMTHITLAGYRALGRSRSITTININAWALSLDIDRALRTMADEGMPLKTLNLFTQDDDEHGHDDVISVVARFAQTLENLSIKDFRFENRDEGLHPLSQCHNLRSIEIKNRGDDNVRSITGSFVIQISDGCPLLEKVTITNMIAVDVEAATFVNFTPFFERFPKLKEFNVNIHTDAEVKALVQHCPLLERIRIGCLLGQEHSEITDVSLVAIAQGLRFLTDIEIIDTQCTDAGLFSLAKGDFSLLKRVQFQHGSWEQGYPHLITEEGVKEFQAAIQKVCKEIRISCSKYMRIFDLHF